MRKDISIESMLGGDKINKSKLARKYNFCWRTIDRRLNPDKYKKKNKNEIKISFLGRYLPSFPLHW